MLVSSIHHRMPLLSFSPCYLPLPLYFYSVIFAFLLLLVIFFFFSLQPFRSYCTYVPSWQLKSTGPRKRWPICWMMQWTHTSPLCRVYLWEWSTLRSWTPTSCWRLSKSILPCVLLRYDGETHQWQGVRWSLKCLCKFWALNLGGAREPQTVMCLFWH